MTAKSPPPSLLQTAIAEYDAGRMTQAERLCRSVLVLEPKQIDALHLLGIIAIQTQRPQQAIEVLQRAAALAPDDAEIQSSLGNALCDCGQSEAALAHYDRAIALRPKFADAHHFRSAALLELGRVPEAIESCRRAIALAPDNADMHHSLANMLGRIERPAEALAAIDRALALSPDDAQVLIDRGGVLRTLNRTVEALASFDRALALQPNSAALHLLRGNVLAGLGQPDEALASFDRAIHLKPDLAEAHHGRANVLVELRRHAEALAGFERAAALQPDYPFLAGAKVLARLRLCDWNGIEADLQALADGVTAGRKVCPPQAALAALDSPALQRQAAEIWSGGKPPRRLTGPVAARPRDAKLRIGYFSSDLRDHAVAHRMAQVFDAHDRDRFEITAFSLRAAPDVMRLRLKRVFDQFIDAEELSDADVARQARGLGIDIAVDLNGFTPGGRTGIFALRAAPIQVSYLGYPGTLGARYYDYLLADHVLVPAEARVHYAEKIACLPAYLASAAGAADDPSRQAGERLFARGELGLPATGFVFCCFNSNYKLHPAMFAHWMRILGQVDGSVLLLYAENHAVVPNLQRAAAAHGIDPQRLVFVKRVARPDYLARMRACDLFLDTLPYSAGSSAGDALTIGLPVLTCTGQTFAGRSTASLLTTLDLPELVTSSPADYETRAIELAQRPERLEEVRQKLQQQIAAGARSETGRFTRGLEAAYVAMFERLRSGLPPDHLDPTA